MAFENYNIADLGTAILNEDIGENDDSFGLVNINNLPDSNAILTLAELGADNETILYIEKIKYDSLANGELTGVVRGFGGTQKRSFSQGALVRLNIEVEVLKDIKGELVRLEQDKANLSGASFTGLVEITRNNNALNLKGDLYSYIEWKKLDGTSRGYTGFYNDETMFFKNKDSVGFFIKGQEINHTGYYKHLKLQDSGDQSLEFAFDDSGSYEKHFFRNYQGTLYHYLTTAKYGSGNGVISYSKNKMELNGYTDLKLSGGRFDALGDIRLGSYNNYDLKIGISSYGGGTEFLRFGSWASDNSTFFTKVVLNPKNGNFGINDFDPDEKLVVGGNIKAKGGNGYGKFLPYGGDGYSLELGIFDRITDNGDTINTNSKIYQWLRTTGDGNSEIQFYHYPSKNGTTQAFHWWLSNKYDYATGQFITSFSDVIELFNVLSAADGNKIRKDSNGFLKIG